MSTLRSKLFVLAAVIIVWTAIQPGILSAQNSGAGSDANTRLLWRATDSSISVWKLNTSLGFVTSRVYGPYDGWLPIAITTGANNNTYVLWRHTTGLVSLWVLNTNLDFVSSVLYGPYNGWIAETLSIDTNGNSFPRLIWRNTNGAVSIWLLNPSLGFVTSALYGPYFGYDPGSASAAASDGNAERAAAAMK